MVCVNCGNAVEHGDNLILLKISCGPPNASAYPCKECGRLHWADGLGVFNRQGCAAFLEEGHLVNRDAEGKETSRF